MADYIFDIDENDYLYRRTITVKEISGSDRTDLPILLELNSSNFNFDFAKPDGTDLRIAEDSGTYVLNIWIYSWDVVSETAKIWFKLPSLLANEEKTLYVFWGNASASDVTDSDVVGFLFVDPFDGGNYDPTKWYIPGSTVYTTGDPIDGTLNWTAHVRTTTSFPSGSIGFTGTGSFSIQVFEANTDMQHTFEDNVTMVTYEGLGIEGPGDAYGFTVSYYESTDNMYYSVENRPTLSSGSGNWEHEGHGDTLVKNIALYTAAGNILSVIDKVFIREYFGPNTDPTVTSSGLLVPYENVPPQDLDFRSYSSDQTNINYKHESSTEGDPYKLSENSYYDIEDVWTTTHSGLTELTLNFALKGDNLASESFLHYDSSHELYLAASKLSVADDDVYWQATTTSGYAAIDFETQDYKVGVLLLRGLEGYLGGLPNNFTFDGSDSDPRFSSDSAWTNLYTGQLDQHAEWQIKVITYTAIYRYYRINVIDTYGDVIILKDWEMYGYEPGLVTKSINQLRLLPPVFGSNTECFPKYIGFYGGTLSGTWDELITPRKTYTPFEEGPLDYWQEYSFDNSEDYWIYKATVSGSWGSAATNLMIAEWEMKELL